MGYYFYYPNENKVIIVRMGVMLEEEFLTRGRANNILDMEEIPEKHETLEVEPISQPRVVDTESVIQRIVIDMELETQPRQKSRASAILLGIFGGVRDSHSW